MKRLAGVFVVVSLALTGCGGSTCEDLDSAFDDIAKKGKPCGDASSVDEGTFNMTTCEANFDKCTDDEKDALADYANCLSGVDECKPSNPDAFDGAVLGCIFTAAGQISDTCDKAVFGSSIRPPAASYSISR
jgi:hypothetical protein